MEELMCEWLPRTTGIPSHRLRESIRWLRKSNLQHAEIALLGSLDLDTSVACVHLAESVERLISHGIRESAVLAKLRTDATFWPTWAEITAAGVLLGRPNENTKIELEPGRDQGRQPDFLYASDIFPDGVQIEFKAIGLSRREAFFCGQQERLIELVCPDEGLVTLHMNSIHPCRLPTMEEALEMRLNPRQYLKALPNDLRSLSGVVARTRSTQSDYLRRVAMRFSDGVGQFDATGKSKCLVAIHWSNTASVKMIASSLSQIKFPNHVVGVMIVGSALVLPQPFPSLHTLCFVSPIDRIFDPDKSMYLSSFSDDVARGVHVRLDSVTGVQAVLVRARTGHKSWVPLIKRFGSRRLFPFNIYWS